MQIKYVVHSATEQPFQVTVPLNGVEVQASVNGLVVELVSEDGTMSRTIRVPPQDVATAKALYVEGAHINTVDSAAAAPQE